MSDNDLIRRGDVLEILDNLRGQDLAGANWIVDDITDYAYALPADPRAAAAVALAEASDVYFSEVGDFGDTPVSGTLWKIVEGKLAAWREVNK
jgi:hypothetical protein